MPIVSIVEGQQLSAAAAAAAAACCRYFYFYCYVCCCLYHPALNNACCCFALTAALLCHGLLLQSVLLLLVQAWQPATAMISLPLPVIFWMFADNASFSIISPLVVEQLLNVSSGRPRVEDPRPYTELKHVLI